jgi:two-component system, chemotaxis family, chemotaxis protein CheY
MKIRALVVDDVPVVRTLVRKVLTTTKLADFEFAEARDGEEALVMFQTEPYDLILVDWNMPRMNGLALADRIRRLPNTAHVKIVMVTSEASLSKMMEAADNAGINAYVVKPFTADELVLKLKPVLDEIAEYRKKHRGLLGRIFGMS